MRYFIFSDFVGRRSDLHFEHTPRDDADNLHIRRSAEERLQKLCTLTREDIRPETPQLFADLVHIMKDLDSDSLRDLYSKVKDRTFCRGNQERTKCVFVWKLEY